MKWPVNSNIPGVDSNGKVTMGRSYGIAKVAVTSKDGRYTDTCTNQLLFKDVTDTAKYYYNPVYRAADRAITKGYSDGSFRPNATCLREHVVTFTDTLIRD
ncbi:MAG: S-layer homology domain-containing protein [Solobacterium sp.]|nr:S-layer homology domain-containing protein [Solobacterium sp.]